jgi:hypothetical protein
MVCRRGWHRAWGAAVILLAACAAPGAAQEKGDGPSTLFLTYRCDPAKRAAFRSHMDGAGVAQLEKWKREGRFEDYLVLFSSYVNRRELDMLVRIDFARYVDTEKWKAIERTNPGGLLPEGLALCSPETSYLADLAATGASPDRDAAQGVYLYIPYHFEKGIGKPEYRKYFETYVKPQNEGWIAEKVLAAWSVYLNQHAAGAPWDALILYEYAGAAGLARRDTVKGGVRARLRNDPAWRAVSESKEGVRTEDQVIVMDPIRPR